LAVTHKSVSSVVVEELFSGTGTYDFDYTVTAVRQGYEDFQVIRPSIDIQKIAPEAFQMGESLPDDSFIPAQPATNE
jgi:hypothetical protein